MYHYYDEVWDHDRGRMVKTLAERIPEENEIAGKVALTTGSRFEDYVGDELRTRTCLSDSVLRGYDVEGQAKYTNYKEKPGCKVDFKLTKPGMPDIVFEAKQCGDVSSTMQKLEYQFKCFDHGCYGLNFFLVYDHRRKTLNNAGWKDIHYEKIYTNKLHEKYKRQGRYMKFIDHNDLDEELELFRRFRGL